MFLDQLHVKSSCFIFIYFVIYFFFKGRGGVPRAFTPHLVLGYRACSALLILYKFVGVDSACFISNATCFYFELNQFQYYLKDWRRKVG